MTSATHILLFKNTLYISESLILQRLPYEAVYLQNNRKNKALKSWRWMKYYGTYYYDYERIPNNIRLGHKDDLELQAKVIEDDRLNSFKRAFERECEEHKSLNADYYQYDIEHKLNADRAHELCRAHGVTVTILKWEGEKRYKAHGLTKAEMWDCMRQTANKLCPYTFKMKNPVSLQNKVKKLPTDPVELRDALISGKLGNQSARKVGREDNKIVSTDTGEVFDFDIHQVLFFQYWMNPYKSNKLTKRQVYDKYLAACQEQSTEPVSLSTVKSYINKNRHWMSLERDGFAVYNERYAPYIPQHKLKFSGSMWGADFSGLKLLYKDKGKARSPYMLRIVDIASEKIVGWALTDGGEDWQTVLQALKMAVDNNLNHAAVEFITDNGGAFISKDIRPRLSRLFNKHRPITLGNKQANPTEVYVKLLSDYSRKFENWSMLGFNSSFKNIENRANEDRMDISKLPTKAEVYQQAADLVEMWNSEARPSGRIPNEYHENNRNAELPEVTPRSYRFTFGNHTQLAFASARSIINVRHNGGFLKFNVADWDRTLDLVAQNSTDKNMTVKMVFTEQAADLYSLEGKYLATLEPVQYSHKGIAEKTPETDKAYKDHRAKKKTYKEETEEQINHLVEASQAIQLPYGITAKLNGNAKENSQALEHKSIANEPEDEDFDIDNFQFNNL